MVWIVVGLSSGQIDFGREPVQVDQGSSARKSSTSWDTAEEYNKRLERAAAVIAGTNRAESGDYRIGAGDLLQVSVYAAPDLERTVRVSADGSISLPLIGDVSARGLTVHELEKEIAGLLGKNYMNHPQVSVFVKEIQSHTVSVIGAVAKPGTFQIRGPETLVQVLSLAEGLADDAGDRVIVMRNGGGPGLLAPGSPDSQGISAALDESTGTKTLAGNSRNHSANENGNLQISLNDLLASRDPRYDILVYPGDVVKVPPAGIVYVVGQVRKPGGFLLKTNQSLSVLQALALAEGTTSTAAEKKARIIRTEEPSGKRDGIPIDLKRILAGKAPDPKLQAKDILFVPNSAGKTAFYRGAEAAVSITGGLIVYRSW